MARYDEAFHIDLLLRRSVYTADVYPFHLVERQMSSYVLLGLSYIVEGSGSMLCISGPLTSGLVLQFHPPAPVRSTRLSMIIRYVRWYSSEKVPIRVGVKGSGCDGRLRLLPP